MKPLRLYVEDFLCYDKCFINFDSFESALIVAKIDDNDELSNGAGKTSIFKAIEFALFNHIDIKLESIIRDDTDGCRIVFDFEDNGDIYRVSRQRTKKSKDFSLFKKTHNDESGIHIIDEVEGYHVATDASKLSDDWVDLSSTRDGDTEKELFKIIKTNYKSFSSTVHFVQNDLGGIATATPEKRKGIFKDALELSIYSKLEKLAKIKFAKLSKDFDKTNIIIETIGDVSAEAKILAESLETNISELKSLDASMISASAHTAEAESVYLESKENVAVLKRAVSTLVNKKKELEGEITKAKASNTDYIAKSEKIVTEAKEIIGIIEKITEEKLHLESIDVSSIGDVKTRNEHLQTTIADSNAIIKSNILKCDDLNVPFPNDDLCKHCRQKMTPEHKEECSKVIQKDKAKCRRSIADAKKEIIIANEEVLINNGTINKFNKVAKQIADLDAKIAAKNNEVIVKRAAYKDYKAFVTSFGDDLLDKQVALDSVIIELEQSNASELEVLDKESLVAKNALDQSVEVRDAIAKKSAHLMNEQAVIQYNIKKKGEDKVKLDKLVSEKAQLIAKMEHYPSVISAFGTSGIPSLIIRNVLDDLQNATNKLLEQLKPGLQLQFMIQKETREEETLDIRYFINGRKRYYEQLSGAMKLSVMFSLKLGLSFLLQKMMGSNIPLLLLDEIDQSLDRAGVDAFADIVKHFQKEFKILVITHNDRLKDKIPNLIVVNQDRNKVSKAKVEASW